MMTEKIPNSHNEKISQESERSGDKVMETRTRRRQLNNATQLSAEKSERNLNSEIGIETYKCLNGELTKKNQELLQRFRLLQKEVNILKKELLERREVEQTLRKNILHLVSRSFNAILSELYCKSNNSQNSSILTTIGDNSSNTIAVNRSSGGNNLQAQESPRNYEIVTRSMRDVSSTSRQQSFKIDRQPLSEIKPVISHNCNVTYRKNKLKSSTEAKNSTKVESGNNSFKNIIEKLSSIGKGFPRRDGMNVNEANMRRLPNRNWNILEDINTLNNEMGNDSIIKQLKNLCSNAELKPFQSYDQEDEVNESSNQREEDEFCITGDIETNTLINTMRELSTISEELTSYIKVDTTATSFAHRRSGNMLKHTNILNETNFNNGSIVNAVSSTPCKVKCYSVLKLKKAKVKLQRLDPKLILNFAIKNPMSQLGELQNPTQFIQNLNSRPKRKTATNNLAELDLRRKMRRNL